MKKNEKDNAAEETMNPEDGFTEEEAAGAAETEEAEEDAAAAKEDETEDTADAAEEAEGKKRRMPRKKKILLIAVIILAVLAAAYLIVGIYFTKHYLPNTWINGVDASAKTVEEVQQAITEEVEGYSFVIEARDYDAVTVTGESVGLEISFDDTLDNLLKDQPSFAWIANLQNEKSHEPDKLLSYDEAMLASVLAEQSFMNEEEMTVSKNAKIKYSEDTEQFEIKAAVFGTYVEAETVEAAAGAAILELAETVDLEEAGCYTDPEYTEESEEVISARTEMNELLNTEIAYDMEDAGTITISKDEKSLWIKVNKKMEVSIDEEAVAEFVSDFASQYDTQYTAHTLSTSYGATVTISNGNYGWRIDQDAETAQLIEDIQAKEDVTREPEYSSRAASHTGNDYGNTYVEINLTAQHLYFYKNGSLVVQSDFVSGNLSKGYDTPTGIYGITYKERDATLNGEDYSTPVSFWMPFNGGVGLHDATWRSSFGGTIYKTNGSHGCINLPYSVAQTIFENISTNDPVLVYTLAGTEQSSDEEEEEEEEDDEEEEEEEEDDGEEDQDD